MSAFVALFHTQEDIKEQMEKMLKETKVCPRCKQERPAFKRVAIPNFVPADEGGKHICMACKKAEPRVCPRCGEKRQRFDEKGESAFHPVLKVPGEIEYVCGSCKKRAEDVVRNSSPWGN